MCWKICQVEVLLLATWSKSILRSSHRRCSLRKCILRNFAKFIGKYLCQSVFFNKVAGLRLQVCNFIKKRPWLRCLFAVNFAKFLITAFLQNTSGRLLVYIHGQGLFQHWTYHCHYNVFCLKNLTNTYTSSLKRLYCIWESLWIFRKCMVYMTKITDCL